MTQHRLATHWGAENTQQTLVDKRTVEGLHCATQTNKTGCTRDSGQEREGPPALSKAWPVPRITAVKGRWELGGRGGEGHLPQVWPPIHQVKDLRRVEELLELAKEFDSLIVPTLGVDKGQQRAGAGGGARCLPEPWHKGGKKRVKHAALIQGMDFLQQSCSLTCWSWSRRVPSKYLVLYRMKT